MKKYICLLVLLVIGVFAISAISADAAEVIDSGYYWPHNWVLTDDGTLTISGTGAVRGCPTTYTDCVVHIEIEDGAT